MPSHTRKESDDPGGIRFEIRELLRPDAFPHPVARLELRETHLSWIVLTGRDAYKIKKALKLDFIDASSLERRRHYCEEELRLNRRLAPELYLDVVPITRTAGGLRIAGAGEAAEYAVHMRQFDPGDELSSLLEQEAVSLREIVGLGETLARFHLSASVAPWTGSHERTRWTCNTVLDNIDQLRSYTKRAGSPPELERLAAWTHERIADLQHASREREQSGFFRECHGDLHAGNVVRWLNRLMPFDCIEFDPNLRWIDVVDDTAFLVMDLTGHRRADLACALLSRYLEITGDYDGLRLLPFYAVHRALVRAKVDALTAGQVPERAAALRDRMHGRVRTALHWSARRHPVLILMHGLSGSGKSWLSERLVARVPALRIRSDVERKRLCGQAGHKPEGFRAGIYAPEVSRRTYGRLADCAESCLSAGFNTIIDAAFLDAADRALLCRVATRLGVPHVIVSCEADRRTLAARITKRRQEGSDPSDADLAVLDAQLEACQPLTASERSHAIFADTTLPDSAERVSASIRALCGDAEGERGETAAF